MSLYCQYSISAQCPPISLSPFFCQTPVHDPAVQTISRPVYHSSRLLRQTVLSPEPSYLCLSNTLQWPAYWQSDLARRAPRWRDGPGGSPSTGYCAPKRSAEPVYVRLRYLWSQNTRLHILWLASAYGRSRVLRTLAREPVQR